MGDDYEIKMSMKSKSEINDRGCHLTSVFLRLQEQFGHSLSVILIDVNLATKNIQSV